MILPKSKRKHESNFGNQLIKKKQKDLTLDILALLSNLFYSLISCAKACHYKINEIASNFGFSNVECYDLIKSKQSNTIYKEDLHKFYRDNQIQVTQLEMELLMDYLDKNKDDQVAFNEFAIQLSPNEIEQIQ